MVESYAKKAIELIQNQGEVVLDSIHNAFLLVQSLTNKDLSGVLAALAAEQKDLNQIIQAIKEAFSL